MSQSLEVNIKATSDVPKAMDKAKAATDGFGKQVQDIRNKFSAGFKDIFLGFVAPMIIVQKIISSITEAYEKSKKLSKDALDYGSDSTNRYVNAEESAIRRLIKLREEDRNNRNLAEVGTREAYADILMTDPEGIKIFNKNRSFGQGFRPYKDGDIFKGFDRIAAEEMSKNPVVRKQLDEIVKKMLPGLETGNKEFKAPEGFSNVIGVGPNPVMEAMNAQLEEQQKQTALLEKIANKDGAAPDDFTKTPQK